MIGDALMQEIDRLEDGEAKVCLYLKEGNTLGQPSFRSFVEGFASTVEVVGDLGRAIRMQEPDGDIQIVPESEIRRVEISNR